MEATTLDDVVQQTTKLGPRDAPLNLSLIHILFNYAYAILRASVTRSIIASGLSPKLGVQHQNKYNPFPLSDDVMEPYRPFADLAVMELVDSGELSITKESRAHLRTLLAQDTLISKLRRPLLIAISITTSSLAQVYSGGAKTLVLPRIP